MKRSNNHPSQNASCTYFLTIEFQFKSDVCYFLLSVGIITFKSRKTKLLECVLKKPKPTELSKILNFNIVQGLREHYWLRCNHEYKIFTTVRNCFKLYEKTWKKRNTIGLFKHQLQMHGLMEESEDSAVVLHFSELPFIHPDVNNVQNQFYVIIFVYRTGLKL